VDFSRPIRRLTGDEALALLRPKRAGSSGSQPATQSASKDQPSWLARLMRFFSTLKQKA
jgi:lysozyme